MSKDEVKNNDYVGDAARQEKVQQGPYKTEKVWDWSCGAPPDKCWRASSKKAVTLPIGKKPDPCRTCGGEDWNKAPGERTRGIESKPAPLENPCLGIITVLKVGILISLNCF